MKKITEARLQQDIFTHHWNNFPQERKLLFMVYNNAVNNIQGAQLKSQGMIAGVSDLVYLNPVLGRPQFLELKIEGGRQSQSQKDWEALITTFGYEYHIVKSLEDFLIIRKGGTK